MKNVHVGTIVALILTLLFVWIIPWLTIWTAFGAANQLMAGLALLLISLWLMSEGKKNAWALYPSFFMIVTTFAALHLPGLHQLCETGHPRDQGPGRHRRRARRRHRPGPAGGSGVPHHRWRESAAQATGGKAAKPA